MAALNSSDHTLQWNYPQPSETTPKHLKPAINSPENGCKSWRDSTSFKEGGQSMDSIEYIRPRIRKDLLPHDFFQEGNINDSDFRCNSSGGSSFSFASCSRPSFLGQEYSAKFHESEVSYESVNSAATFSEQEENVPQLGKQLYRFWPNTARREKVPLRNWNYSTMPGTNYSHWADSSVSSKRTPMRKASSFSRDSHASPDHKKNICRRRGEVRDRGRMTPNKLSPINKSPVHSDGSVNKELYNDLVEMIPLVESFMGKQERSHLSHHGSLVHTPVPSKEDSSRKYRGGSSSLRSSRRQMRYDCPEAKDEGPIWVEQLNHLRRIEADDEHSTCENPVESNESMPDLLRLQCQIDELNQKLWEKDCLLRSMPHTRSEPDAESLAEIARLRKKVEGLEKELAEKDHETQSTRQKLEESLNEIMKLRSDMQAAECGCLKTDGKTLNDEELNELRCQVAALRYQLEAADLKHMQELMEGPGAPEGSLTGHASEDLDTIMLDWDKDDEVLMDEHNEPNQNDKDAENIELTKRKYFAALIFAREKPGEDSLVPAAEFRTRLESFLGIPSFSSFVNDPSNPNSLRKI